MPNDFPDARLLDTNGIRLAVYEAGSGPPVILLHGFPELAYSWRHQLPALADAGYRAIAPDQRGYGRSDKPVEVREYTVQKLIGDIDGLLTALDLEQALFVGHDWGAMLLWYMALLAPQRMAGLINLNIPFHARPDVDPMLRARERLGDSFYIVNFQDSDEADRRFAGDVPHFFDVMMRRGQITRDVFETLPREKRVLSLLKAMDRRESGGVPLLSDAEKKVYVDAFSNGGFSGPINWYRNWSHNWASTAGVPQQVRVPTLFIGAVDDVVVPLEYIESMKPSFDDLEVHMVEDCGHWTQQEKPEEVNRVMIEWLRRRYPPDRA
ncbi:MAG: alpha/beta hydrolase [Gammaproteobacteria bacterium]|nr:alpha/beta hydrolase [Gammaproteobacteria bacterium]